MHRNYRDLIKRINDGKNLEAVLPEYTAQMSALLYEYSLLQTSMEFYSLKEMLEDSSDDLGDIDDITTKLKQWIEEVFHTEENGEFREVHIQQIDAMRTEIMEKMELLTIYADKLQIYEYVLNRKENEFKEEKSSIPDDMFTSRLLQYIFASKDNVIVNQRIQEAVGQLPVRMLKSKYFEYLRDSLHCYKDADKESVDTFIYMIRTCGMVYEYKEQDTCYGYILDHLKTLEKVDYSNLTKKEFEACSKILKTVSAKVALLSDYNVQIEKVLNSLYIFMLVRPYVLDVDKKVEDNCYTIITETAKYLNLKVNEELETKISNLFDELLGIQERHIEEYQYLSGGLEVVKESFNDLMESMTLNSQMECLYMADKLCNNSIFIDIHKEQETHQVTSDYIEYQLEHLIQDLTKLFKEHPQCINRAVMAATLSKLPVFFNNSNEVKQYVENSINQCQNEAEKIAAKELLLSLMSQDE